MHTDFIKSPAVATRVENIGVRRFTHWPNNRVNHALVNLEKMVAAFKRCGLEDDSYSQISELSDDVCEASSEILTAFSQWAQTHLSTCRNNQMHIDRMEQKWSNIYKTVLGCVTDQQFNSSTVLGSVTDQSVVATNPNTHPYCDKLDTWTAQCSSEQCYPYVHDYHYYWNDETLEGTWEEYTCEFTISTVCDPNFVDNIGDDCDYYVRATGGKCQFTPNGNLLKFGVLTAEGFKTALNCPACGCGENGPINMHDRDDSRSLTGEDIKIKKNKKN